MIAGGQSTCTEKIQESLEVKVKNYFLKRGDNLP